MADWYKMFPVDWNDGTTNLTLEQEAAYLRICNAIYISGGPIPNNKFVLAGLFRCDARRAVRLLNELVEAQKVIVDGPLIRNRRADDELTTRQRLSNDRQTAGKRGGIASGISRANSLKNKEPGEASASSQSNEIRGDKIRGDKKETDASASAKKVALSGDSAWWDEFWSAYPHKVGKADAVKAFKRAAGRVDRETMMAGLRRYIAKTDDRPWCNPSTWLNQDRWSDQPAAQPQRGRQPRPRSASDFGHELLQEIENGRSNENSIGHSAAGLLPSPQT